MSHSPTTTGAIPYMVPSGAVLSSDNLYRYRLWRIWDPSRQLLNIIGLNPSTADATEDDPTLKRCMAFAQREGYGGLVLTNLFAYRSTDPEEMMEADDPVGPENDAHLLVAANECRQVLLAWGNGGSYLDRSAQVQAMLGPDRLCLGVTAQGEPRDPLYLKKDEPFVPFQRTRTMANAMQALGHDIIHALQELGRSEAVLDRPGWTLVIQERLARLARRYGYKHAPSPETGEWLYDHVWYRSTTDAATGQERTLEVPLVVECEWDNRLAAIAEDFDKLLLANAALRVFVCGWYRSFPPEPVITYCEAAVREFGQLGNGARFLLCFLPEEVELGEFRFHIITK